jgi:hypothetical protein
MRYAVLHFAVTLMMCVGFKAEATALPLECGMQELQVKCNVLQNGVVIKNVVFNRGNCQSAQDFMNDEISIFKKNIAMTERGLATQALTETMRDTYKLMIKNQNNAINERVEKFQKVYVFGDQIDIFHSCKNVLEFTVQTNMGDWTWGKQGVSQTTPQSAPSQASRSSSDLDKLTTGVTLQSQGKYTEALQVLLPLAEKGDPYAQYGVGIMYDNGQGVTEDNGAAAKWYMKAAVQGQAEAQYNLAKMYDLGEGVERDEATAMLWYRKAAEQGDELAIEALRAE